LPKIAIAVEAIARGTLSPVELVDFCFQRINAHEPQVRAWVMLDEAGARREAERLAELARGGQMLGPLHGIPIAIKDIVDVAGWPTKCGSPLRETHVAKRDAEIVVRLRSAGAILLGKTVTTQFASFDPPPTRNPWNLERTPGGSSSGSAAAVATGMCMAAIGSQTGGSIVRPAAYCGVVGLKPTYGAVPLDGIMPLAWHLDHPGPIARNVDDAALMFEVIAGKPAEGRSFPTVKEVTAWKGRPTELAWLRGFFWDRADAEVRQATAQAIDRLRDAGVSVTADVEPPPSFADVIAQHRCIMAVEAAAYHRTDFAATPEQFGPRIASLLTEGLEATAIDYADALQHQQQLAHDLEPLCAGGRLLVMPATTTPAPGRDTTGDPSFNSPWSHVGFPSMTIPCGLSSDGLPCGLQLVGPPHSERPLLAAAERCETMLAFDRTPSLV